MDLPSAVKQWQTLLGEPNVLLGEAAAAAYGADTSGAHRHIPAALRIKDSASLRDILRIASRHQVPVYPISTGKNWGYGSALPARNGCVILDLSPLRKIIGFDAELGVVTLIAIGGEDTLGVAKKLTDEGIPVVGVPWSPV